MSEVFHKVSVTGHRPQHLTGQQMEWAQQELHRIIRKLRDEHGMEVAISGMALGVDTWWAQMALGADVPLWAFVPFPEQPDRWSARDRRQYDYLLAHATRTWIGRPGYAVGKLHDRNDRMRAESDLVVAVWRPSMQSGGTASQVAKCRAEGKPVVLLDLDRMVTVKQW